MRATSPVVLVGMMGAGKTTVGRLLAERLGVAFLDSDAMVEAATGRPVERLWAESGEAELRRQESRALNRALDGSDGGSVIATGGGCVLDESNRRLLRERGVVVWLRADPATLAARVSGGQGRPLLVGDVAVTLTDLAAERDPLYAEVASMVVDVDSATPSEVVDRVLAGIA